MEHPQVPERRAATPISSTARDPLARTDAVLAARTRPMSERLEVALSWNSVAADLRSGLLAVRGRTDPVR